jgi:hypothetical protein
MLVDEVTVTAAIESMSKLSTALLEATMTMNK